MIVKELPATADSIEKLKDISRKQTTAIFRSGVESGLEMVMDFLEKVVVDYEKVGLKDVLDDFLDFARKEKMKAELELEQASDGVIDEGRILN